LEAVAFRPPTFQPSFSEVVPNSSKWLAPAS
jgi:hypothetical protein